MTNPAASSPADGLAVAEALRRGDITGIEVVAAAVGTAHSARADGTFLTVTAERAARETETGMTRRARGADRSALDGVPVAWKDMIDVAGVVTTEGSATRLDASAAHADAPVVSALSDAGMVCIGKTGLSEFAFSGLGINPHLGTPIPPGVVDEPARIPGGSSSGSAVAVARGIVPIAIGTDTSGSVRIPAAFCGLVGYRAGLRRYPQTGFHPLAATLDTMGVLARSVRDVIAVDDILRRATGHPTPDRVPPSSTPRIVLPVGELLDDVDDVVRRRFDVAVNRLADIAQIEERAVPVLADAQALMDRHGTIVGAEASSRLGPVATGPLASRMDPGVLRRIVLARERADQVGPVYAAIPELRQRLITELDGALLLCPTVRHTPPPLASLLADDELYDQTNARTLRTTMLLSYLGMPGLSLPIAAPPAGAALLLSAPDGQDDFLFGAALRVEQALSHR